MADELARIQQRFFRLVRAPRGVAPELPALSREDPDGVPLLGWIRAPDEAAAIGRLDVYAEMYFFRLLDVLRADYPKLTAAIGDDAMHNLATDYLLAHPSDNPSLRHLGRHLPAFLRAHPRGVDRPVLVDLADLEWARVEAFDVPDEAVLERAAVAAIAPEDWPAHRFRAVRSVGLLRLAYPAHEAWAALDSGSGLPEGGPRPTDVIVWRSGWKVLHRPAAAGESVALGALLAGAPFAAVCEAVAGAGTSDAEAARSVVEMLLRWIDEGLLRA